MSTPLTFAIDARELGLAKLAELLSEFSQMFAEIDVEVSGGIRTLDLVIEAMSLNSPATFRCTVRPRQHVRRDMSHRAVSACVRGLSLVNQQIRPADFNDDALTHLQKLAVAMAASIDGFTVTSPIDEETTPRVTSRTAMAVERILPHGYSVGSVEGTLEALSIHDAPRFTVYDAVTGRGVRCSFAAKDLQLVKDAVGRKVVIAGRLRRDPEGNPQQISLVEEFSIIDEPPTGPVRSVAGIYAGLGDSSEYLRKTIRDAE